MTESYSWYDFLTESIGVQDEIMKTCFPLLLHSSDPLNKTQQDFTPFLEHILVQKLT